VDLADSSRFLRRLGDAKLIHPYRSAGGHRRYFRYQLRLAARARQLCDQGTDNFMNPTGHGNDA
jgi:DNA-binding transcriptional MerR regulator